jgi:hypothetical protein
MADWAGPAAIGIWIVLTTLAVRAASIEYNEPVFKGIMYGVPALASALFRYRSKRFGLAIACFFAASFAVPPAVQSTRFIDRNFFGLHRVADSAGPGGPYRQLDHGTTVHSKQSLAIGRSCEPLAYYHPSGPLGQIMQAWGAQPHGGRVAVIGLGAGSMACYAQPGQRWTYYELDPMMAQLAQDSRLFTFLQQSRAPYSIILGDARISMQAAPAAGFDLLVIDAFSSDAVPAHLLTREAISLYASTLAPGAVMAFHLSSRYLSLEHVVARGLAAEGWIGYVQYDHEVTFEEAQYGKAASDWVVASQQSGRLAPIAADLRWQRLTNDGKPAWTDDYADVLEAYRWN